ncbi:hypothetical protein EVAR_46219_1 [Eumeta japonica]|uniref:Uncharacterized protein n=1 Tax=Eumeta variegata TaxID=151549 RepID=A0A4C1XQH8_EUMVA|nr:hypothetical protein EVAR_46219_1 [Eumeta japonica]
MQRVLTRVHILQELGHRFINSLKVLQEPQQIAYITFVAKLIIHRHINKPLCSQLLSPRVLHHTHTKLFWSRNATFDAKAGAGSDQQVPSANKARGTPRRGADCQRRRRAAGTRRRMFEAEHFVYRLAAENALDSLSAPAGPGRLYRDLATGTTSYILPAYGNGTFLPCPPTEVAYVFAALSGAPVTYKRSYLFLAVHGSKTRRRYRATATSRDHK